MIVLHPLISFVLVLIPCTQAEGIWVLDVKQSPNGGSETNVTGKLLWVLSTKSGLSCAALCLQVRGCFSFGYQDHICHGYLSSEALRHPVGTPDIIQCHFMRYFKMNKRYFTNKGMPEQAAGDDEISVVKKHATKNHKSEGMKEQERKENKSKAMDDGYKTLKSGRTYMNVKKHYGGNREHALKVCQSEGATLIKLDTRKKVRMFKKQFRDRHTGDRSFWIGLSDIYDNDTWYWIDGTPLGRYNNWDFQEPDNRYDGFEENCAGIILRRFYSGKWFDVPCDRGMEFVCERV